MVSIYLGFKIISGLAPKRLVDKRVIVVSQIASMRLTLEETVRVLGLTVTIESAMFMLAGYGATGDFGSDSERISTVTVGIVGVVC